MSVKILSNPGEVIMMLSHDNCSSCEVSLVIQVASSVWGQLVGDLKLILTSGLNRLVRWTVEGGVLLNVIRSMTYTPASFGCIYVTEEQQQI